MSEYVTVNIEQGMPYADQAIKRLTFHIHLNKRQNGKAIKVIHGFGSSGTGGVIRVRTRSYLEALRKKGEISDFICGEKFSIFDAATRKAMDKCPDLREDRDLDRHNNGVTIIIL